MSELSYQDDLTDSREWYLACASADRLIQAKGYEVLWGYLFNAAFYVLRDQMEAEALAQDCAQLALARVYHRLQECREPAAFRIWAQRIACRAAIDELRRRKRLVPLNEPESTDDPAASSTANLASFDIDVLEQIDLNDLRRLINRAPISDRSRRVVAGRFVDNVPDELLARNESQLSGQTVLPSHIQVTRTKDIKRLRDWEPLRAFLKAAE